MPGTFAEFKTVDECPPEFWRLLEEARQRPLIPVTRKRKITDKMPKPRAPGAVKRSGGRTK